jgi:hypothetical protein
VLKGAVAEVGVDWERVFVLDVWGVGGVVVEKYIVIGTVDESAELEVGRVVELAGGGLAQIDAKLLATANA